MCVPQAFSAIQGVMSITNSIVKDVADNKQQSRANEYRAQIAMNNIKNANDEARRQIQTGIEKSREEKIEGMKKASTLLAKNASSNSLATSDSNLLNFEDINNSSYANSEEILNSYRLRADDYFKQANNYLTSYNHTRNAYNSSINKNRLNSLGSYMNVASKWYSNMEDIL